MKKGHLLSDQTTRKQKAVEFWQKVTNAYTKLGLTPEQISHKFKNRRTGKSYSIKHIYWILRENGVLA